MEKVAHFFVVTGEFITQHARQLWADENQPKRALDLLQFGLMGAEIDQVLSILTGQTKLTGDSIKGLEIVEDGTTLSPCGQPLPTLAEAFDRMQCRAEVAERDTRDLIEIESLDDGATIASPHGLVKVSKQTRDELGKGEIEWEDVRIYRSIDHNWTSDAPERAALILPEEDEDEPELPPPTSYPTITTDIGWLSPDGRFYPCGWMEHLSLADRVNKANPSYNPNDEPMIGGWSHKLEKLGWIKLAGLQGVFVGDRQATKRQDKAIIDWCLGEGKDLTKLPWWLEPDLED